ncbi:ENDD1 protein, partial [Polypterus senegalus]
MESSTAWLGDGVATRALPRLKNPAGRVISPTWNTSGWDILISRSSQHTEWFPLVVLEDIEENKHKQEMMDSPHDEATVKKIKNQAVDLDYKDSGYSRGHLFPNSFAADEDQAESTFTLTNTAPQLQSSNEAWAQEVEEPMLKLIKLIAGLTTITKHTL